MACGRLSLLLLLLGLSQVVVHAHFFSRDRHRPGRGRGGGLAGLRRPAWGGGLRARRPGFMRDFFSPQQGRRGHRHSVQAAREDSKEERGGSRRRFQFSFRRRRPTSGSNEKFRESVYPRRPSRPYSSQSSRPDTRDRSSISDLLSKLMNRHRQRHSSEESSEESREESGGFRRRFQFVFHHGRPGSDSGLDAWMKRLLHRKQEWLRRHLPGDLHWLLGLFKPGHTQHRPQTPCPTTTTTPRTTTASTTTASTTTPRTTTASTTTPTSSPTTTTSATTTTNLPRLTSPPVKDIVEEGSGVTGVVEEGSGVISEFQVRALGELRQTGRPSFPARPTPMPWRENESGGATPGNPDVIAISAKPSAATKAVMFTLPDLVA